MAKPGRREATPEEFKAMSHPLRLQILRACLHEPLTNKEIADRVGKEPATTLHHVRLLVRTGFLEPRPVRTGARGALEKPYLATRKTWVLSVDTYDETDRLRSDLATIDAVRAEMAEAGADSSLAGARLGLKLSPARAQALAERIEALVHEWAEEPEDPEGERYGLYVALHRLR